LSKGKREVRVTIQQPEKVPPTLAEKGKAFASVITSQLKLIDQSTTSFDEHSLAAEFDWKKARDSKRALMAKQHNPQTVTNLYLQDNVTTKKAKP